MKALTRRAEFAKAIRGHWGFRLLAWGWGALGILSILGGKFLPQFPWYVWLIGLLAILAAKTFEGAFRAYGKAPEEAAGSSPSQATAALAPSIATATGISIKASPIRSHASARSAPDLANGLKQSPPPQKPNLIHTGTKIVHTDFFQSKLLGEIFIESEDEMAPRGIIACFCNELSDSRGVAYAKYVRACVNFRDTRGRKVGNEIACACWLEHHADSISFAPGEHHCVLLGLIEMGRALRVPWKKRRKAMMRTAFSTECETFFEPATIELALVGENNELLADRLLLDITLEDRNASVTPRKP